MADQSPAGQADLIFTGGAVYTVLSDGQRMTRAPGRGHRPARHRGGRAWRPDRRGRLR